MSTNIQDEIKGMTMMASSSVLFALVAGLLRYASEAVSTGALLSLMTLALSVLIGILLFGESVTMEEIVGIAIVFGSCFLLVVVRR